MPDLFDIIHREWPTIKAAPFSFFIALVACIAVVWVVFEVTYKWRLRNDNRDINLKNEARNSGHTSATGGTATARTGDSSSNATGGTGGSSSATGGSVIQNFYDRAVSPVPPLPIPEKKNHHNIQLIRPKSIWVEADGNEFFERSYDTGFKAFVACFRNETIFGRTDIVDANFVSASGLYFDSQKNEINEGVAGLCWMNNTRDYVHIEVGKATQNVIVAVFNKSKNSFFIPFLEERATQWGPSFSIDACEVSKELSSIALRLVGSNGALLPDIYFDMKKIGDDWNMALRASNSPIVSEAITLLPRVYVADWLDESNLFVPASPIVLENRGREVAHAVQILPITIFYKEVKFDPIDTIAVGEKKKVFPRISGADGDHNSLFYLLKQELDARNKAQGKQDIAITFPLTIVYKDPSGVHNCETSADLVYNPINRETGAAAKKNKWEDWPHESLGWYQITHHQFK